MLLVVICLVLRGLKLRKLVAKGWSDVSPGLFFGEWGRVGAGGKNLICLCRGIVVGRIKCGKMG